MFPEKVMKDELVFKIRDLPVISNVNLDFLSISDDEKEKERLIVENFDDILLLSKYSKNEEEYKYVGLVISLRGDIKRIKVEFDKKLGLDETREAFLKIIFPNGTPASIDLLMKLR